MVKSILEGRKTLEYKQCLATIYACHIKTLLNERNTTLNDTKIAERNSLSNPAIGIMATWKTYGSVGLNWPIDTESSITSVRNFVTPNCDVKLSTHTVESAPAASKLKSYFLNWTTPETTESLTERSLVVDQNRFTDGSKRMDSQKMGSNCFARIAIRVKTGMEEYAHTN